MAVLVQRAENGSPVSVHIHASFPTAQLQDLNQDEDQETESWPSEPTNRRPLAAGPATQTTCHSEQLWTGTPARPRLERPPGHTALQTVSRQTRAGQAHRVPACETGSATVLPVQADVSGAPGECG